MGKSMRGVLVGVIVSSLVHLYFSGKDYEHNQRLVDDLYGRVQRMDYIARAWKRMFDDEHARYNIHKESHSCYSTVPPNEYPNWTLTEDMYDVPVDEYPNDVDPHRVR